MAEREIRDRAVALTCCIHRGYFFQRKLKRAHDHITVNDLQKTISLIGDGRCRQFHQKAVPGSDQRQDNCRWPGVEPELRPATIRKAGRNHVEVKLQERSFGWNAEWRLRRREISCASWQESLGQKPLVGLFDALLFGSGDYSTLRTGDTAGSKGNNAENSAQQQIGHRKKLLLQSRSRVASAEILYDDAGFIKLFLRCAGPEVVGFKCLPFLNVEVPGEVALDQFPLNLIDGFQDLTVCKVKVLDRDTGFFRQ